MCEIKHIPAPWRFVEREVMEDGSVYPQHIVGGPNEIQVCILEGNSVAELAIKEKWPSGKPRCADLILAAPDLLEALQALMFHDGDGWDADGWLNEADLSKARAAIAKATGASHV